MRRLIGILPLILLVVGSAGARTWTVAADGTGDFLNIQDAIDAAGEGDVIEIHPGLYHGAINTWGTPVDLIGVQGAKVTIVDADRQGAALTVPSTPGGTPVIRGLAFRNGIGKLLRDGAREGRFGGGLSLFHSLLQMDACEVRENLARRGGGLRGFSSEVRELRGSGIRSSPTTGQARRGACRHSMRTWRLSELRSPGAPTFPSSPISRWWTPSSG